MRHRLVTAARQGGCKAPGDGAEPRARQHGPGEPRVTHGAHARPAGRSAPLGTRQGRARTQRARRGGPCPGRGNSGGTLAAPTPARVPVRLTDPRPGSQHCEPARPCPARNRAAPPPAPGSLARGHHPAAAQRTHQPRRGRGSSFPARASAL